MALIGESKAGKTRCVFEELRMRVPHAVVFAPHRRPEALREVVGNRRFRSPKHWSVLWLDDLEDFLDLTGERGVDDELLDELLALPRVVVAITAGARWGMERLADAPSLARLTPEDGAEGKQIVSVLGQALADAISGEGLGAACVAGHELLDIHDSGRHPKAESAQAVPEGAIVVECLIAAAQLGLGSLTRQRLFEVYGQTQTAHASQESFDRGLRWATTALYGEVALVLGDDDAFRAYGYVVENAAPIGDYRARAERALAVTINVDDLIAMAERAREAHELKRALRLYELALPRIDDESRQAALIGNLGIVQRDLGRLEDALASQQRALAINERVYGPDHHEVAITLSNLGNAQSELGGFEDALVSQERALAIEELVYGPDHREVAITLTNLGGVQRRLGRFEDALASQQRALAIKERVYGPDHHEVAITLTNLGIVLSELGRFEDALASQQRALAIRERVYGPDHREVAITLNSLGNVQGELGRFEDALASQQRALAIKERVYGPDHREVAITLTNLGIVHSQLGRFEDALVSLQRALAIKERVYGADYHEVAITLTNLGVVQRTLRRFEDALASQQRALAINERVYGPDHHEVAITLANLGNVQSELGQPGQAEVSLRQALAIFQNQLPEDHPHTRQARRQLAQLVAVRGEVLLNIRDDEDEAAGTGEPHGH